MIKNIRFFVNSNDRSLRNSVVIKDKFKRAGFNITDKDNYELAVAIGGDGSFLRMIKSNMFSSDKYYVGINSGHLGFLQEVTMDDLDKFIYELKNNQYKVDKVSIQETEIKLAGKEIRFYSLNEILIRNIMHKTLDLNIYLNDKLLEVFKGDGVMISTTCGSTAHNLSYGGSIVFNTLPTLQITPIGPINSKSYRTLINPIIIPDRNDICLDRNNIILTPASETNNYDIVIDGENNQYTNVESISTRISEQKIKCLRFSHYDFVDKLRDKLLS